MIRALLEKLSKMVFLRFALFALCNFCVPSAANASQTITIQGRLTINHMGNATEIILPVASAQIEIYDEEIIQYPVTGWGHLPWPDVHLGTVYTDSDGYFSFTVSNDDGATILGDEKGRDIYLKVKAANNAAVVRNNPEWMFGTV